MGGPYRYPEWRPMPEWRHVFLPKTTSPAWNGVVFSEVEAWCVAQFGPFVTGCQRSRIGYSFAFQRDSEAMAFRLRWC